MIELMNLPSRQESLYRTMHNTFTSYRQNNWGVKTLVRWLGYLNNAPSSILEVGCGNGKLCKLLADMGYDVTGLDIVPGPYDRDGYDFVKHDMTKGRLPFEDKTFDYCLAFDVLEHLPQKWIEESLWDMFRVAHNVIILIPGNHELKYELKRRLHLTVRPADWWIEKFNRLANSSEDKHITIFPDQRVGFERILFFCKSK